MKEKRIKNCWIQYGVKFGFGIGFDVSRYYLNLDLGFWWISVEL